MDEREPNYDPVRIKPIEGAYGKKLIVFGNRIY